MLAEQAEASGHFPTLNAARSVQLRLLAHRGEAALATAAADELAARAREAGISGEITAAFPAAAQLQLAAGRPEDARSILHEFEQLGATDDLAYAQFLPEIVRGALALSALELARRLTDAVGPHTPLLERALISCRAQFGEYGGKPAEAATDYAEAAARWQEFGNVPERAYALLGQGRCLAALGKPEAEQPLRDARDLFASMGYKPALAETEALLGQDEAAAV